MKRIYLHGRMIRIPILISLAFAICAFVDMYIQSDYSIQNLALLILVVGFAILMIFWLYSTGIFIDGKRNKLTIVTGLFQADKKEIVLSGLESIDVELNGKCGMTFVIHYKYGRHENFAYKFHRISFVERSQYKRIRKQVRMLNIPKQEIL
ncbi:MAG: hypothetical protein IJW70_09195 [Clostridia bacterium]|nr:hypothetical protein [Clostridia bacterium]